MRHLPWGCQLSLCARRSLELVPRVLDLAALENLRGASLLSIAPARSSGRLSVVVAIECRFCFRGRAQAYKSILYKIVRYRTNALFGFRMSFLCLRFISLWPLSRGGARCGLGHHSKTRFKYPGEYLCASLNRPILLR